MVEILILTRGSLIILRKGNLKTLLVESKIYKYVFARLKSLKKKRNVF